VYVSLAPLLQQRRLKFRDVPLQGTESGTVSFDVEWVPDQPAASGSRLKSCSGLLCALGGGVCCGGEQPAVGTSAEAKLVAKKLMLQETSTPHNRPTRAQAPDPAALRLCSRVCGA